LQLVGNLYVPDGDRHFVSLGDDIEHYQEGQRIRALHFVKTWTRAVDLGAHIGIFSRHFAELFEEVLSFEPTVETRQCLERNVPPNVRIIPYAVGDREETVTFRRHIKNSGASEMVSEDEARGPDFEYYTVRMVPLDSLKLEGVGLIKIDVQGAELKALIGAADTLRRCKPVVLIEEKPLKVKGAAESMERISECRDFLVGCGFREGEKVGADRIYLGA
jgi:FkbM family methyltransferase